MISEARGASCSRGPCRSLGAATGGQASRASRPGFASLIAAALIACGPVLAQEEHEEQEGNHGAAEKRACTRCNGAARVTCGACGGEGEIYHPCAVCKGGGRKPCTVCCNPDGREGSSAEPGKLACSLCRGTGSRASGKTCSRCQGRQTTTCLTCAGKGTLACRKRVFDKVCPDCRFVGKVPCPACEGGGIETRALPGRERGAGLEKESLDGSTSGLASASKPPRAPLSAEMEARYRTLSDIHKSHVDIFAVDQRPRMGPWKTQAAHLARKLEDGGGAAGEINKYISRLNSFRLRFGELRELFLDGYRSFRKVESVRSSRDRALAATFPSTRAAAEEEWNERMDLVIRIAEKHVARLEEEKPAWLIKETEDLERNWSELKTSAGAAVVALEEASRERAEAKRREKETPPPARPAGRRRESPRADEYPEDPGPALEWMESDPEPAALAAKEEPEESGAEPGMEGESRPASSGTRSSGGALASGGAPASGGARRAWTALLWALGGFLVATLLYRARAASRGARADAAPEDARPPG